MDKFSRIFLFGKIDFNPEKIFSGIWIIPIFGFTFVPGRRAVNATEVASFQGNSGKSDPKTELFTLWTVPFWDFAFTPLAKKINLKTKNKNQNGLHTRFVFINSG